MEEISTYQPEYNLLRDAYLGSKETLRNKLIYLANMAQSEQWDYKGSTEKQILYNYLCYTYDRIKEEDKTTREAKIQLLLPLFLQSKDVADLALVVDKGEYGYVGKTILTLEWAYVNSRRIVRPDVDWLKI